MPERITPQQKKKLERLAKVLDGGEVALLQQLEEVEDATEAKIADLASQIPPIEEVIARVKDGEKGETGERGEKGDKGDAGRDGIDGKDGAPGKDGRDGAPGRDGRDGKDGQDGVDGKDGFVDTATIGYLEDRITTLAEELEKAKNVEVRPVEAGAGRGFYVYVDGIKKGIVNTLNFKAGNNMAISHSKVNGLDTITFTASGGGPGGIDIETPAESPNASRTAFTVSAEPQYMIADGTTYFDGAGYTYAALTVTFDVPPSQFVRAII